ncbi:MAG: hypothetical protein E7457_02000 [Ruminococcaceae bacterium]|nr:hypothetical protein [Oscillospiraceae bacterium]
MLQQHSTRKLNGIIFLMFFSCTLATIQFEGRSLFLFVMLGFCLVMVFSRRKIRFCPSILVNFLFLSSVFSAVSSCFSDVPASYQKAAVVMAIYDLILYFAAAYLFDLLKVDREKILRVIRRAFLAGCILQLVWVPLQYVTYHYMDLDLNQLIFVDTLHLMEEASFIRANVYYPSGFTWHSALLAPMFVLAFALYDNVWIRALILFDAMICGNSTALIGTVFCAALLALAWVGRNWHRHVVRRSTVISLLVLAVVGVTALVGLGMLDTLWTAFTKVWTRLFTENKDASTRAHLGYYADYFTVAKDMPLMQLVFGYGIGCSGWPITEMRDRYTDLANWAVECDIVNIALSRGVVGFISYYFFLFYTAIRGLKINYKYFVVILSFFLQGFGYNIQWEYVVLIEIILLFTILLDIDFFGSAKPAQGQTKTVFDTGEQPYETAGQHCCYDISQSESAGTGHCVDPGTGL